MVQATRSLCLLGTILFAAGPAAAQNGTDGCDAACVAAAELVLANLRGETPATLVNPEVWGRRRK